MIIKELKLNNIGVFKGETTIAFSCQDDKPVTLIGGKNGSGKTTILESFLLALYGNRSRNSLNFNSYSDYISDLIHANEKEASITLTFDRQELGDSKEYSLRRSWAFLDSNKVKEKLKIYTDGDYNESISKSWPEYVEQVLPESLSGLFIFDGEKIEKLADPETSTQALKASLYGLLGLDLVDQLKKDLIEYKRRLVLTVPDQLEGNEQKRIQELENELQHLKTQTDHAAEKIEKLKNELEEKNDNLLRVKENFSKAGGEIFESREATLMKLSEAKSRLQATNDQALNLSAGQLPLILNKSLIEKIFEVGEATSTADESEVLLRNFKKRDERLLLALSDGENFNEDHLAFIDKYLTEDRSQLETSYVPPFDVNQSVLQSAKEITSTGGHLLIDTLKNILIDIETFSKEISDYETLLSATPDAKQIVSLVEDVQNAENSVSYCEDALKNAETELRQCEYNYDEKMRVFEKLANSIFDSDAANSRSARINREIAKVRLALQKFETRIVKKNIESIQKDILSALKLLNRKKTLVTNISINPKSLEVELEDSNGSILKSERLSAGERQLFATSLLWGLSKSTGQNLPTIVDTPIARLDSAHRKYLVDNYFPKASSQVVLLSTDEEIVDDYYHALSESIGKEYLLEFDETTGNSTLVKGYF